MRLVRLELEGFKSFGTYAKLEIPKGITCIVGPNGSGKSNVVDAIRWIFGERANSKLRMSSSSDVLYAGSPTMKKAEKAWVKATFLSGDERISIERIYTADGRNSYFLNGNPAKLKEISKIFMGTGTGKDLYSVVGQGEISNLVNSSPQQVKVLVEEAAGVAVYKTRKAETLVKLAEVEENLQRLQDVINEVSRNLKSLNLKSKRAMRYKEYENELFDRKKKYFGHFYLLNSRKLEEIEKRSSQLSSEMQEAQKELFDLEIQASELKELSSGVEEEIRRFENELEKYREREKTLANLKELYSSKLSADRTSYVELGTKKDSMREELDRALERLEELKRLIASLENEYSKDEEELKKLKSVFDEKTEAISRHEKRKAEIESEISTLIKRMNSLEVAKSKALESLKDLEERLKVVNLKIEEEIQKASQLQKDLDEIQKRENNAAEKLAGKSKKLSEIEEKRKRTQEKISSLQKKRDDLKVKIMELNAKMNLIKKSLEEYSGYSRAVRTVMNAKIDGVIDVVANLLDVPRDVEIAVSVLLGGRTQNVVVKDSKTAEKCVEFLKKNRAGRATFIPMDMISTKEPTMNSSIISAPGMIGYAYKIVKSVKGYEGLVNFLFSKDLIVKTLADAISLKKERGVRSRMVSLDGQLVSHFGTITGGSVEKSEFVFQRRLLKEIQFKVEELQQELQLAESEIETYKISLEILFKEKNEVESSLLKDNMELNNSRNTKESLLARLATLQKDVNELEKFKKDYIKRMEKAKETVKLSQREMDEIEKKKSELENALQGDSMEDLKERQEIEKLQEKMIDLKMKMNSTGERESGYRKEALRLKKRVEEIEEGILNTNSMLEKVSKDMKQSEEKLKSVESDLSSLRSDIEELFNRSKNSKGNRLETIQKIEKLESDMNERKKKIDGIRESLHALDLERVSAENALQNAKEELLKFSENLEKYELLPDDELERMAFEIEEYERKMKFLGPVDMDAIVEYAKVEERHVDLLEQKKDLEKSKNTLEDVIKRTDEEARILLAETLENINERFSKMISVLFSQGSGELSFIEGQDILESPVEINVKLVGKRTQKLYMLSGGERSLVGLAFIFSLLMINPSAFYVLDEVDAALDDFSTQRFVNLLSEYSKSSNFIVMTHNKIVMEKADTLYGITMVNGASAVIPVELSEFSETNVG